MELDRTHEAIISIDEEVDSERSYGPMMAQLVRQQRSGKKTSYPSCRLLPAAHLSALCPLPAIPQETLWAPELPR